MEAFGFIETFGYVCSVEAADAALKAANVKLVGRQNVKGGILTIIVKGDVGAVKAAVDAGVAASGKIGKVLASHVIPRMDGNIDSILFSEVYAAQAKKVEVKTIAKADVKTVAKLDVKTVAKVEEKVKTEPPKAKVGAEQASSNQAPKANAKAPVKPIPTKEVKVQIKPEASKPQAKESPKPEVAKTQVKDAPKPEANKQQVKEDPKDKK